MRFRTPPSQEFVRSVLQGGSYLEGMDLVAQAETFLQLVREADSEKLKPRMVDRFSESWCEHPPVTWSGCVEEVGELTMARAVVCSWLPSGPVEVLFKLEHVGERRYLRIHSLAGKVSGFDLEATPRNKSWCFGPGGKKQLSTLSWQDKQATADLLLVGKPKGAKTLTLKSKSGEPVRLERREKWDRGRPPASIVDEQQRGSEPPSTHGVLHYFCSTNEP